jgi:hypothetical protein
VNNLRKDSVAYMVIFPINNYHFNSEGNNNTYLSPIKVFVFIKFKIKYVIKKGVFKMFYILYDSHSNYQLSQYFMCPPENTFSFQKTELQSIFPKFVKPQDPNYITIVDKEIKLTCKRRMVNSVNLGIELDKSFSLYEIEVYCETENKPPQILTFNNRPTILIGDLEEDKYYKARIRGISDDKGTMTKWSQEISFYPLKGSFFCEFFLNCFSIISFEIVYLFH